MIVRWDYRPNPSVNVFHCVQLSQLTESDNEKPRRRRRKYEDETDTSDDDESDDDEDDETDKQQVRKRGRARKNLVHGFTGPEMRRLIKSIKKFPRPTDRSVELRDIFYTRLILDRTILSEPQIITLCICYPV